MKLKKLCECDIIKVALCCTQREVYSFRRVGLRVVQGGKNMKREHKEILILSVLGGMIGAAGALGQGNENNILYILIILVCLVAGIIRIIRMKEDEE